MVLFRARTYCESSSDDLDMNNDMSSKKFCKFSEILIEKKNRNFRRIAKNCEAKRIRFASLRRKNSGFRFRFASLFESKKNSLSLRFRNRFLAKIYRPAWSTSRPEQLRRLVFKAAAMCRDFQRRNGKSDRF